jgi:rRNA maturation RNase YbeY
MSITLSSRVRFFFDGTEPNLNRRRKLKSFINLIFVREKKRINTITFIFTNDRIIRQINRKYLGHDFFTDIITFELSEKGERIMAEVYISCDRVKENALVHKTNYKEELHRVIFHGVLHLCGYGDKTRQQMATMRLKEDSYLAKYFK